MSASLDLNLIPLLRQNNQEQTTFPGLLTSSPPRRAARGRESDMLLLYLTLVGSAPLPEDQMQTLLQGLADTYYKTAGTVTAAMRAVADGLNQFILERNLRSSNTGRQSTAWLTQAVQRGEVLSLGHSGPVRSWLLSGEGREFYDPQGSGRGLGLGRQVGVRYFQAAMPANTVVVLAHQAAPNWELPVLQTAMRQGLEPLRRLLAASAENNLSALIVASQVGTGKFTIYRPRSAPDMARPTPAPSEPPSQSASAIPPAPPAAEALPTTQPAEIAAVEAVDSTWVEPAPVAGPAPSGSPVEQPAGRPTAAAAPSSPARRPPQAPPIKKAPLQNEMGVKALRTAQSLVAGLRSVLQKTARGLKSFLGRLLPDATVLDIAPSTLLFFAVALPLLIAVIGAVIYIERGQSTQHQAYFQQAVVAAAQARTQADPVAEHAAWTAVLGHLDQAEQYQMTVQSQELRREAILALDSLDAIERLAYEPALVGSLPDDVDIKRLAVFESDLYMLDRKEGRVLRAVFTGGGYQLDNSFRCGSVPAPQYVGPLVDMAPLPRMNEYGATLIAIDANGMLVQCIPGGAPLIQQLAPPTTAFGSPVAIDLNEGDLYVLDPTNNAVWIYRSMDFGVPPRFFFGNQIPPLQDVIDLVVNGDDLYLLHTDGHQTRCTYSSYVESPTRCEAPYIYADRRDGRQDGAVIRDALFDQFMFAPPPDPSLYLLDPANQAVYHMGMHLSVQRQYRPAVQVQDAKATAFTVGPNRWIFLALGNQVLYAVLP